METNLTKYKKDIDTLIDRGAKLYNGLVWELRDELGNIYKNLSSERKE